MGAIEIGGMDVTMRPGASFGEIFAGIEPTDEELRAIEGGEDTGELAEVIELGSVRIYDPEVAMNSLRARAPREMYVGGSGPGSYDETIELAFTGTERIEGIEITRQQLDDEKSKKGAAETQTEADRPAINVTAHPSAKPKSRQSAPDKPKHWQDDANCLGVDPDLFFPGRGESTRPAKEVCRSCVVEDKCREQSLEQKEKHGIWGGLSERERRRLRRQRAQMSVSKVAVSSAV